MSQSRKPLLLILGKLPPPYFGPAIATEILLKSGLNQSYRLSHLNTAINSSIAGMGRANLRKIGLNLGIYARLCRLMMRERPEYVLIPISQTTTGFLKDAVFIWIASLFRNRILIQLRGSDFRNWQERSSSLMRTITRLSCSRADGVIVLGESLRYLFEGYFRKDQIYVVPNGANFAIPEFKKSEESVKVLYLANMLESKGISDVIEAMSILKKDSLAISLDVAGSWGAEAIMKHCEGLVTRENLPVRFHPPLDAVQKLEMMAKADIFVFPPREPEGHPWVLVEAMACGLPIISTDQGAIRESVIEGENGFLVETRSPVAIAGRLKELVLDAEKRYRMGRRSREIYEDRFTEEKMVAALMKALGNTE
jgi:glycosyltransferase involved in cell wall biosynthesis